jgi:tetraspanin-13/31
MVVLFIIFLIQFSVSCAALAIIKNDENKIIEAAWKKSASSSPSLIIQAEQTFDCCGLGLDTTADPQVTTDPTQEDMQFSIDNNVFDRFPNAKCHHGPENGTIPVPPGCQTCYSLISDKVNSGFNGAGGLGLFFSFSEFIGVWLAARFRNQKDPRANPSAFL